MSQTITSEVQPKEQNEAKHNPYETFREAIRATVVATVMKVRDTSVSFNWSLGKVISACAEACKLPTVVPDDFKRIVKFEYQKLQERVAVDENYELQRSRQDFVLNDGQMKARLTNISLRIISLETQLEEARKAYSRLGTKSLDESLSAEKRAGLHKKMHRYTVIIDHVTAELARQQKLQVEAQAVAPK